MSLPRFALLLSCAVLFIVPAQSNAQTTIPQPEFHVLLVGNSLTYANNLPALLRAVGASQGTPIITETYAAPGPGGMLSDRWRDGIAGDALRTRKFDVVVLQEKSGNLAACMATAEQRKAPCAASLHAYSEFAALANSRGARTLIFTVWGKDDKWQGRLNRSSRMIAEKTSAQVFNAAGILKALQKSKPQATLFPDDVHPSTEASLMLALALYREITGVTPTAQNLLVTAPLLPVNAAVSSTAAMETQSGLKGNGQSIEVPAKLLEPLIQALPAPGLAEVEPTRRGR